jgi:hypothetical protein
MCSGARVLQQRTTIDSRPCAPDDIKVPHKVSVSYLTGTTKQKYDLNLTCEEHHLINGCGKD